MKEEDLKKMALIDANLNRAGEGLRVIEDWSRFYLRDRKLTGAIREIRHALWSTVRDTYPQIIKGRETGEDILASLEEGEREKSRDIPRASLNRIKEALRVLEEFGKMVSKEAGAEFKKMRFKIYDIEKEFYE